MIFLKIKLVLTNDTLEEISCFVNKYSRVLVWLKLLVVLADYHALLFQGFIKIDLLSVIQVTFSYPLFQRQSIRRPGYSVVLLFQSWRGR